MKKFFDRKSNIIISSAIWNLIATCLDALQSPVLLMVITRTIGLDIAGYFTLGYSYATLFLIIGKYNMRNYQVTVYDDSKEGFSDFLFSRFFTTAAMLIVAGITVIYKSNTSLYTGTKILVISLIILSKVVDSIEDVFLAMYQQQGRLDIGAKILSIRLMGYIIICVVVMLLSENIITALVVSDLFSLFTSVLFIKETVIIFPKWEFKYNKNRVKKILINCFPLFSGAFCSILVINIPKYALDNILSDSMQAIFGIIMLPAQVIYIITSAIFQPQIKELMLKWRKGSLSEFNKFVRKEIIIIIATSIVGAVFCFLFGIQVLEWIYQVDLSNYTLEFFLIFTGGILLGLSAFISTLLTIMRNQKFVLAGYGFTALISALLIPFLVKIYQNFFICSFGYFLSMAIELLIFIILYVTAIKYNRKPGGR